MSDERLRARELLDRLEADHKAWASVAVAFTRAIGGTPHDAGLTFFKAVRAVLAAAPAKAEGLDEKSVGVIVRRMRLTSPFVRQPRIAENICAEYAALAALTASESEAKE